MIENPFFSGGGGCISLSVRWKFGCACFVKFYSYANDYGDKTNTKHFWFQFKHRGFCEIDSNCNVATSLFTIANLNVFSLFTVDRYQWPCNGSGGFTGWTLPKPRPQETRSSSTYLCWTLLMHPVPQDIPEAQLPAQTRVRALRWAKKSVINLLGFLFFYFVWSF